MAPGTVEVARGEEGEEVAEERWRDVAVFVSVSDQTEFGSHACGLQQWQRKKEQKTRTTKIVATQKVEQVEGEVGVGVEVEVEVRDTQHWRRRRKN